jgi:hypothetical protein
MTAPQSKGLVSELTLNRAKETVGYLMQKVKQFRYDETNNGRIFQERADAVQRLIDFVEKESACEPAE